MGVNFEHGNYFCCWKLAEAASFQLLVLLDLVKQLLTKGIKKEARDELMETFPTQGNCNQPARGCASQARDM